MDKWHHQFEKLRQQWSNYTWLENEFIPVDKNMIAKIGVAWVVKIPGTDFKEPVGWEVEIIDTPKGISERCRQLVKWLKNPPPHFYDTLSTYDECQDLQFDDKCEELDDIRMRRKYLRFSLGDEPREFLTIPANEYEVFKKICCRCKQKVYKNSGTNYDTDVVCCRKKRHKNIPCKLTMKSSRHEINRRGQTCTDRLMSEEHLGRNNEILSNHDILGEIEQEIDNYIIEHPSPIELIQEDPNATENLSQAEQQKDLITENKSKPSVLNGNNQETLSVKQPSTMDAGLMCKLQLPEKPKNQDNTDSAPKENKENNNLKNTQGLLKGEPAAKNQNEIAAQGEHVGVNTPRPRHRPHIPSLEAFDDDLVSRGTSLNYRDTEHTFFKRRSADTAYNLPTLNETRNRRHHHRRHRGRYHDERDADTMTLFNYLPSDVSANMVDEGVNVDTTKRFPDTGGKS